MHVWLSTFPRPHETERVARVAEASGFFGLLLTDSQCLLGDPFVELGAAADATTTLHLGTCATNVVTRHPTVLASLAATLQQRSGGRMHLGAGRGDSAVSKVGLHPLSVDAYGEALTSLRALLRGESVAFDGVDAALTWLDADLPPTPVLGVASGPRTIAAAAGHADGLVLQVGSDPDAVARCVDQARAAAPGDNLTIAAYVIVGLDAGDGAPPIDGVTPLLARMATSTLGDAGTPQATAAAAAGRDYTVARHGLPATTDADVIAGYALRGDADHCADQLRRIAASGCDELVVILGSMTTPTDDLIDLVQAFGTTVLPALATVG